MSVLQSYLLLINLITFAIYGIDKFNAQTKRRRVSERTLLLLALVGGSVGALTGIIFFHHKTLHKTFTIGVPLILAVQLVVAFFILWD